MKRLLKLDKGKEKRSHGAHLQASGGKCVGAIESWPSMESRAGPMVWTALKW